LPLTLAILPAFVVQTGDGETYALPMASIDATMEIFPEHVEWNGPQPGVMHNLDWLPLYDLGALLGCGSAPLTRRRVAALVTVEGQQVAIVVKPLPRVLQGISSLAGCTILSDGRVVLILDPVALLSARQALGATA
jgi:chemosensory pili system protein ChpA (sensor histidine kinase/response regulator)